MARPKRRSGAELARALNCDPFKYLCERFNGMGAGKEKDGIALELLPYCLPKLKAIEVSASEGAKFQVIIGGTPTVGADDDKAEGGGDG